MKFAPRRAAATASSTLVIPQIFTRTDMFLSSLARARAPTVQRQFRGGERRGVSPTWLVVSLSSHVGLTPRRSPWDRLQFSIRTKRCKNHESPRRRSRSPPATRRRSIRRAVEQYGHLVG